MQALFTYIVKSALSTLPPPHQHTADNFDIALLWMSKVLDFKVRLSDRLAKKNLTDLQDQKGRERGEGGAGNTGDQN